LREYQTLKWHHEITSRCIAGGFWDKTVEQPEIKALVEFNLPPLDYVKKLFEIRDPHLISYLQQWDKNFKEAWCADHENHPDCKKAAE